MNRNEILNETMILANTINGYLDYRSSADFYMAIEDCIKFFDKFKFLDKVMYLCSRKYIEIPNSIKLYLTYDKKLQKDIMYTFLLCSKINKASKKELKDKNSN